jgi:aryl carrier-like protein
MLAKFRFIVPPEPPEVGLAAWKEAAVLAGGPDDIYPSEHQDLYARIAADGCVVSEMPPGYRAKARDFPRRNRIISGLSLAVTVVERMRRAGLHADVRALFATPTLAALAELQERHQRQEVIQYLVQLHLQVVGMADTKSAGVLDRIQVGLAAVGFLGQERGQQEPRQEFEEKGFFLVE